MAYQGLLKRNELLKRATSMRYTLSEACKESSPIGMQKMPIKKSVEITCDGEETVIIWEINNPKTKWKTREN